MRRPALTCPERKTVRLALKTHRICFYESYCPRSRRGKSCWLFKPTLQDGIDSENRHRANVDAESHGKPQHGPRCIDPDPDL